MATSDDRRSIECNQVFIGRERELQWLLDFYRGHRGAIVISGPPSIGTVTSPIERIWINSLQIRFLRDAGMLVITPPIPDVSKWRQKMHLVTTGAENALMQISKAGHSVAAIDTYLDAE